MPSWTQPSRHPAKGDRSAFDYGAQDRIRQSEIADVGPPAPKVADSLSPASPRRTYGAAPIAETSGWSRKTVRCRRRAFRS
jgi:hypothetical protein